MQRPSNDSIKRSASLRTGSNNAARQAASGSTARTGTASRPASRTTASSGTRRPTASSTRSASPYRSSGTATRSSVPQRNSSFDGFLDEQSVKGQRTTRSTTPSGTGRSASSAQRRPAASAAAKRPASAGAPQRRPSSANRTTGSAPSRNVRTRKKAKRSNFKKILIVYSAILLVILIVGLIIFNSFIANYEKNQPVNIAKSVTEALKEDAATYLSDHKDMISSMADTDEVIRQYVSSISGKDISYVENSDSRAEAPSFDLRADGAVVGKITLEPDGKGSFGLSKWKLASLDVANYIPDTYAYTILAPSGYTVAINGNDLSDSYITAKDETPEILANAAQFIKDVPKYDSYTVSGLLSIPTVTAKDTSGSDVGVAAAQEYFVAGGEPSKDFIADRKDFVESALTSWAYHFINYSNGQAPLSNYVQSGSDLYAYIFGSDTMDPIYTGFYDWEYITNVDFTEFEANNYIQYAEDCFSVDVKYRLKVDFSNNNLSDDAQMLDATWVIVKNNNYWGIADVIYHQGSESSLTNEVASQNATEETTAADSEDTTEEDETTTEK